VSRRGDQRQKKRVKRRGHDQGQVEDPVALYHTISGFGVPCAVKIFIMSYVKNNDYQVTLLPDGPGAVDKSTIIVT
jgi:hypothetical protein